MKTTLLFSIVLVLFACRQPTKDRSNSFKSKELLTKTDNSFRWLLGSWERLDEEKGKSTFEIWKKVDEKEYSGFGFTLQNGDTIWQEHMRLKKDKDTWDLHIKAPEDPEPVIFRMTMSDSTGFTCENPEMEFPKKIKYWKSDVGFRASVSNEETEIQFEFAQRVY